MVKVQEEAPLTSEGRVDIEKWQARICSNSKIESPLFLVKAINLVTELTASENSQTAEVCFDQGLAMAEIMSRLIQDEESIIAALLYCFHQSGLITGNIIAQKLSQKILVLIQAADEMEAIHSISQEQDIEFYDSDQIDKLRKMLLTLSEDIRSILIKLAERICLLRKAKDLPVEKQQKIANEVISIHAPLANRLGIGQIKWEMEDLAFRYLAPKTYKNIARQLDDKRLTREAYINQVIQELNQSIEEQDIKNYAVSGRVKHIFSIWRKMRKKDMLFENIHDIRAVRVMVEKVADCYAVLGIVHSIWQHLPQEFDDYITSPKQNGYQSLHTAVIGPEGKTLEIQIRTWQMHRESELGIAAHWNYKEDNKNQPDGSLEKRISWLTRLIKKQRDISDDEEFVEEVRSQFLQERVYVFTPTGEVRDLPLGSTVLDFAYHIHSEVGNRCRGAKINGKLVPLTQQIKTGQQIEILTGTEARPSRDWLIRHNGYIFTAKARNRILRWFKLRDFDKNLAEGKSLLDKELKRIGLKNVELEALTDRFHLTDSNKFLAALGAGDLRVIQVLNAAQSLVKSEERATQIPLKIDKPTRQRPQADINIFGMKDLLTSMAGCCKPVPGDLIVGYITQGRGVSIHQQNCLDLQKLERSKPERIIDVNWGERAYENYPVDIFIEAEERSNLLSDISKEISLESSKLLGLDMKVNQKNQTVNIYITIEISDLVSLGRLLNRINLIKNIIKAERQ